MFSGLRGMRGFCIAVVLALATACTPMQWVKPDATPAQFAADSQQCEQEAWREAHWNYMGYHPAFTPWMYRDGFGRPFAGRPFGPFYDPFSDRYMEEARLANFCMRAKGYELAPVQK
jgi:hypothetical protein